MSGRKILVSGGSGFIGRPLVDALRRRGDRVVILTRGDAGEQRVHWDPSAGEIDSGALDGIDAVVHLAGESISGFWTARKKRRIIESRKAGTSLLAAAAAAADPAPSVFVSSGAIGIYGNRGDDVLSEQSGVGDGYLAEVVREWEAAADPARGAGIRTINLRIGLVLGNGGGMLGALKPLFKFGAGGRVGNGNQWWSWVTLDDVVRAFIFAIDNEQTSGPYNVAAPNPVTNAEFTKTFARVVRRPAVVPAPAFALRLVLRDMADEMLLCSQRIDTSRIQEAGFSCVDIELEPALRGVLG